MIIYTLLSDLPNKTDHFVIDYPDKSAHQEITGIPRILIIEKGKGRQGYKLWRYDLQGKFIGDTSHFNLEEAKRQAYFEFGDAVGKWEDIPKDHEPIAYVLSKIKLKDYKKHYKELNQFLNEVDFLGVVPEGITNEYEDLINPILKALYENPSKEELGRVLGKGFAEYGFGSSDQPATDFAERILQWWRQKEEK